MSKSFKVAHEAPISILGHVDELTDFSYALVHLFETHPAYFEYFYKARHWRNREVLLDNSIFELGTAFDSDKFVSWIEKLQPNYYVVPDILEDGYGTVESFGAFSVEYKDLPGMRIGTVQGKTYSELVDCYRFMSENAEMIAISFDLSYYQRTALGNTKLQRQMNGRIKLIRDLQNDGIWNKSKPHHLLGCSLAREFKEYVYRGSLFTPNIYSCDTSNPVVAGIKGLRYNTDFGLESKPSQKLIEFIDEKVTDDTLSLIKYNIQQFAKSITV